MSGQVSRLLTEHIKSALVVNEDHAAGVLDDVLLAANAPPKTQQGVGHGARHPRRQSENREGGLSIKFSRGDPY